MCIPTDDYESMKWLTKYKESDVANSNVENDLIKNLEERLICRNNKLSYLIEDDFNCNDRFSSHDEEVFIKIWNDYDLFEKRQAIQNLVWEAEDRLTLCNPLLEKLNELYYEEEDKDYIYSSEQE